MGRKKHTHFLNFSFDSRAASQLKTAIAPVNIKSRDPFSDSITPAQPINTAGGRSAELNGKLQKDSCALPRVYQPRRVYIRRERTLAHLTTLNSASLPDLLHSRSKSIPKPLSQKSFNKHQHARSIIYTGYIPEAVPHRLVVPEVQASTNPRVQLFPRDYPKYRISVEFGLYRNVRKYAGMRGLAASGAAPVSQTVPLYLA